jgi:tetrapyrrole methylase family protein/MazG family protein
VIPRVIVGGLGPAGPELLTAQVVELASTHPSFLRTARHPAASQFDLPSFDHVYESAETFEEVYASIVESLVAAAGEHSTVGYLVPGSPLVAERTVELLRLDTRVETQILPAVSFLDVSWVALGIDPIEAGVRLIDGHRFLVEAAGERGPLLVSQVHDRQVLSDIKLALDPGYFDDSTGDSNEVQGVPVQKVTVLQRLGLPDERVFEVEWHDLDRVVEPDHLTSIYIEHLVAPVANEVVRFHELVRTLRAECPWDQDQTHQSLVRHLIEETYEVVEAIDRLPVQSNGPGSDDAGDHFAALEDELGDLLFQVVFHAVLGAEAGWFDLADVARGVHDKLVRRHPHVFGQNDLVAVDTAVDGAAAVASNWETIKAAERGDSAERSALDGLPPLPALARASKVVSKVAGAGFQWGTWEGAYAKLVEEVDEVAEAIRSGDQSEITHELGDVVMAATTLARLVGTDLDEATRRAIDRVSGRFRTIERLAREAGLSLSDTPLERQLEWWAEAKLVEAQNSA